MSKPFALRAVLPPLLAAVAAAAPAQTAAPTPTPRLRPYPIDLPESFEKAIERGTRTREGRPGANYWTNHAHYDLAIELDVAGKRVEGKGKLTYFNRSPAEIDHLVLHLRQNMMRPGSQRTRTVRVTGGIDVGDVLVDGKKVRARVRDTRLYVSLPEKLPPGGKVTLDLEYAYDVPKAGTAPRNGYEGDDVFYLGYWYPQFAVYDDWNGWTADPYRGNGEFYMGYADYDLAITVPAGYIVRATGELVNPKEVLTKKAQKALEKARQTREIVHVVDPSDLDRGRATAKGRKGKLVWKFRAENVRDTAISIGRTYLWDATHAVVPNQKEQGEEGIVMIHAVYEADAGDWVRAAEYARHTIEFMSRELYPYPWPHMTACEGVIGGGMEFPMMTIIGGRRPAGTIAHELIHMWFPMLIGSNEKRYAWQDEGFTTFWTSLCRDDFTGRKTGPQQGILGYVRSARRIDTVCMRHADTYGTDSFGFASYSKPAAMLHQLRALLGDDTFFGAFRRYARDWAFRHPAPYDFFHTFSDHAGIDLDPYFRTWLFETWKLDHAIEEVAFEGGSTLVDIADLGRAVQPCTVEATYPDGSARRHTVPAEHWLTNRHASVRFEGKAVRVALDPDITTLDIDRTNNTWPR